MIASLITALYLLGIVSAKSAANFLFVSGVMLIAAEIALGIFGLIAFNGFLSIFVGYMILTGDKEAFFGIGVDWSLVFGIAFVEFAVLFAAAAIILRERRRKLSTGVESMIGHKANVVKWHGKKGQVRIQGEIWAAVSDVEMDLKKDEQVTVRELNGLTLKISA